MTREGASIAFPLAGGGAITLAAAVGWPAVVLVAVLVGLALAAGLWVVNNDDRTRRLATLLGRHDNTSRTD